MVLILLTLAAPAAPSPGSAWGLQDLMQSLAAVKSVEAGFRERKELAVLKEPLVTTGVLRYRAPAYLKKQTLEPEPQSYEVDEDWLTIDTLAEGRRLVNLDAYPAIRASVEAIRATLAGDLPTLERYYRARLEGRAEGWTLRLEPTSKALADFVTEVVIRGRRHQVLGVETVETGGDRSVMTIAPKNE